MPNLAKKNEQGRRIGESHPRAILSDHEVDLLFGLLAEREAVITVLRAMGAPQSTIDATLAFQGLSFRCLAIKFEVHYSTIYKIAKGRRRCQTARG